MQYHTCNSKVSLYIVVQLPTIEKINFELVQVASRTALFAVLFQCSGDKNILHMKVQRKLQLNI